MFCERVTDAQKSGHAKRLARNHCDAGFHQQARNRNGRVAVAKMPHVQKHIERAIGAGKIKTFESSHRQFTAIVKGRNGRGHQVPALRQGVGGCVLNESWNARRRMALKVSNQSHCVLRSRGIPDAPASHGKALRQAVDQDELGAKLWTDRQQ